MSTEMNHPKWNYEEFLSFLLIYAAGADMNFSQKEKELIKEKIDFERLETLTAEHDSMSDYQRISVIQSYKGLYFPTVERKEEMLDQVKQLFEADGDFSVMEHNLMLMLHKLL